MARVFFHRKSNGHYVNHVYEIARVPTEGEIVGLPPLDEGSGDNVQLYRVEFVELLVAHENFEVDAEVYMTEYSWDERTRRVNAILDL